MFENKYVFGIVTFVIVSIMLSSNVSAWWNASWDSKQEIQINNTDLEVANYSILLNVTYNANMNADFSDLRFVNGSEDIELGYWIERNVSGVFADVWVKIPDILTNTTNTTIYMYYDNTSIVSSTSNGEDAFLDWHGQSSVDFIDALIIPPVNSVYEASLNIIDEGFFGLSNTQIVNADDGLMIRPIIGADVVVIYTSNEGTKTQVNTGTTISVGTHKVKQTFDGITYRSYFDGVAKGTSTTNLPNENLGLMMYVIGCGGTSSQHYSFARKYLSTTPTYSFGAEEEKPSYIDSCQVIDSSGVYIMNQSIINSATRYCMNISANDVIFDCAGHTIDSDGNADYGIYMYRSTETTTNITIKNCTLTDWDIYNIYLKNVDGNYIYDTNSSNAHVGIEMINSDNNIIRNFTSEWYTGALTAIDMYRNSSNNWVDNVTINLNHVNAKGVFSSSYSRYNNISNSKFSGVGIAIELDEYLGTPDNYTIYNNFFNTSNNLIIEGYTPNDINLNTTKQLGTRIYGNGTQIGGNYWTDLDGSNYSDICVDADNDGFCDIAYSPVAGVYDYLPYTNTISISSCTNITSSGKYYLTSDIIDSTLDQCMNISADDVILDCLGHIIDGDSTYSSIAIYNVNHHNSNIINCNISDWIYYNIYFENSSGNTFNYISSSDAIGGAHNLYALNMSDSNINNSMFDNADLMGINLENSMNVNITNITASKSFYGVYILNSNNTYIKDSNITNNSNGGIVFAGGTNHNIFNNLLNNSVNWVGTPTNINLNTTKQLGTRIYGNGTQIGGNYWTNSTNNGFSDICTDSNTDGFCDTAYNPAAGIYDNLSLSDEYIAGGCTAPSSGNWTLDLSETCSYSSETINLDYLTFTNSGNITLENSKLILKGLLSGLPSNSRIILINSNISMLT